MVLTYSCCDMVKQELKQASGEVKTSSTASSTGKEKKENLTKQQKRRLADRGC